MDAGGDDGASYRGCGGVGSLDPFPVDVLEAFSTKVQYRPAHKKASLKAEIYDFFKKVLRL